MSTNFVQKVSYRGFLSHTFQQGEGDWVSGQLATNRFTIMFVCLCSGLKSAPLKKPCFRLENKLWRGGQPTTQTKKHPKLKIMVFTGPRTLKSMTDKVSTLSGHCGPHMYSVSSWSKKPLFYYKKIMKKKFDVPGILHLESKVWYICRWSVMKFLILEWWPPPVQWPEVFGQIPL